MPYPDQGATSPLPGPPGTVPYDPPYPYGAGQPYVPGQSWQSGYPPYYGWAQPRPTNGLAIASLTVSITAIPLGCLCYGVPTIIGGLVGAVLGHVAQHQIAQDRNQQGAGLALAGIIVGWIGVALAALVVGGLVLLYVTSEGIPDQH
jgi:hypothetical protein